MYFFSTLTNTYAIGLGLWPIYSACLLEQSLIMTLTFMKYKYEKEDACAKQTSKKLSVTVRPSEEDDDGNEDESDDEAAVDVEAAIEFSSMRVKPISDNCCGTGVASMGLMKRGNILQLFSP